MSALIFDNGSGFTKAGVAGYRAPRLVFSTSVAVTPDKKEFYVGDKAQAKRDLVSLSFPCCVKNWDIDGMEKVSSDRACNGYRVADFSGMSIYFVLISVY